MFDETNCKGVQKMKINIFGFSYTTLIVALLLSSAMMLLSIIMFLPSLYFAMCLIEAPEELKIKEAKK